MLFKTQIYEDKASRFQILPKMFMKRFDFKKLKRFEKNTMKASFEKYHWANTIINYVRRNTENGKEHEMTRRRPFYWSQLRPLALCRRTVHSSQYVLSCTLRIIIFFYFCEFIFYCGQQDLRDHFEEENG